MATAQPSEPFGTRLGRLLAERGLQRKQLAAAVRVSPNSVTNWATGRYRPDHEHVALIAAALGTTIDELHGVQTVTTAGRPAEVHAATPDTEAQRIVRALALLDLDDPLAAMQRVTPLLREIAAAARRHSAGRNGTG